MVKIISPHIAKTLDSTNVLDVKHLLGDKKLCACSFDVPCCA